MVLGTTKEINAALEKAGLVYDYFEIALLMCEDALQRDESCGAHFREKFQTEEGEALRDDEHFQYSSAWEWKDENKKHQLHKEKLVFEYEQPNVRSYK